MMALTHNWKLISAWALVAVLIAAVGIFLIAASGLYNVAASKGHSKLANWFLSFGMTNSVRTHAALIEPPDIKSDDQIHLGAAHFHSVCAPCHGAPGQKPNPSMQTMLPSPPKLAPRISEWRDRELFWIVRNGIKYTGMPAWPTQSRDDEVWAVVAFLRSLPDMNPEQYEDLAWGNARRDEASTSTGVDNLLVDSCNRCHDTAGQGPTNRRTPRLAGQKPDYLSRSLIEYASGKRHSGFMQTVAATLTTSEIKALAAHYADLQNADVVSVNFASEQLARGERLASKGSKTNAVPACLACHGSNSSPDYPRLTGQSYDYLVSQLRLWKAGLRMKTDYGMQMGEIAQRMTARQIEDVSAFFSSQNGQGASAPRDNRPESNGRQR